MTDDPVSLLPMDAPPTTAPPDTTPPRPRFSPKDAKIIEALLMGMTYAQAAERAGCSLSTVKRRMADPGFNRRVMEEQEEAIKGVRRRVTASAVAAVQILTGIAGNVAGAAGKPEARTQVYAARAVLAAFVGLQPRGADTTDADLLGTPTIDYVLVGVDPEVLR